jgi:hypothetical protein
MAMNKQLPGTAIFAIKSALLLSPLASLAAQEQPAPAIELGSPFRDNAILQREMDVPVWGWSKPGATVTMEFAGQKQSAKAGEDGNWMLRLKPLAASADPAEMVVQESGNQVVLTFAYNWCVSPLTPMGVAGVIWVPGRVNLGYSPADYSLELEIHARSLPTTYGQEKVSFFYGQPSATLAPGITPPKIENAKATEFEQWPKSLRELDIQIDTAAKNQPHSLPPDP